MSTDTIDFKPIAQQLERRLRDLPARRLIYSGIGLGVLGVAVWAMVATLTDPGDEVGLREAKPLGVASAIAGSVSIVGGVVARIDGHIQDRGREKSKRDLERLMAEAEIMHLRREHQARADIERRFDQVEDRLARIESGIGQRVAEALERQIPVIVATVRRVLAEDAKEAASRTDAQLQEIKERQADLERDMATVILDQRAEMKDGAPGRVLHIRQGWRDDPR